MTRAEIADAITQAFARSPAAARYDELRGARVAAEEREQRAIGARTAERERAALGARATTAERRATQAEGASKRAAAENRRLRKHLDTVASDLAKTRLPSAAEGKG